MTALLDAALAYAAAGWAVFPVEPRGKRPAGHLAPHGLKDATTDPATIRRWWAAVPDANIGIPTGEQFDVIDCDGHGIEVFLTWCDEHDVDLDGHPRAVTGRADGGRHVLVAPTGAGNKTALLEGVDYRGRGGYIVVPPSVHVSGLSYAWKVEPNGAIPTVPEAFLELLTDPVPPPRSRVEPNPMGSTPYGIRALDDELRLLSTARNGERNDQLNHRAFRLYQLVFGGELNEATVEVGLMVTAQMIGLADREIVATMKSARTAALKSPRSRQAQPNGHAPPAPPPAPPPADIPWRTFAALAADTPAVIDWLWQDYLALGTVNSLDGKHKGGKTTLVAHLIRAVLTGADFLERPVRQSPVVYLTEEGPRTFRSLLERAGLTQMDAGHVLSKRQAPGLSWDGLVAAARQKMAETGAKLLIVDTLGKLAGFRDDDENSSGKAGQAMSPLQSLATDLEVVVLITRLDRKGGGEIGESARGSSQIAGDVDVILHLTAVEGEGRERQRNLDALGRFDETPDRLVIELMDGVYREARSALTLAQDALLEAVDCMDEPVALVDLLPELKEMGHIRTIVYAAAKALTAVGRLVETTEKGPSGRMRVCVTARSSSRPRSSREGVDDRDRRSSTTPLRSRGVGVDDCRPAESNESEKRLWTTEHTEPTEPCPRCGSHGWHPPCRPAPSFWRP